MARKQTQTAAEIWDGLMNSKTIVARVPKEGGQQASATFKEAFNHYNSLLGDSLVQLQGGGRRMHGREQEIEMLHAILERPHTPVAILLGHAGVGKTALMEEFSRQLNSGEYQTSANHKYILLALRVGSLSAIGEKRLQRELSNMLTRIYQLEKMAQKAVNDEEIRFVLFIDEVHLLITVFGRGTKVGGDVMKEVLARTPIRVVGATTHAEYDSTIATDAPFSQRFKPIEMSELSPDIVEDILLNWWEKEGIEKNHFHSIPKDIIRRVIHANATYRTSQAEPRKSLDIMEDFYSYCKREDKPITDDVVNHIFKVRFSINLKMSFDPEEVTRKLTERIKGQPFALYTLSRLLRSMALQVDVNDDKPMATALLTGPTGVGKTETVKVITEALYPKQNVLLNINMPDYKGHGSDAAFRKRLGEHIQHVPNSVILLDELEKADKSVMDALLSILDEGLVSYEILTREGLTEVRTQSLRNTIVFATTNKGEEIFQDDAQYSKISNIQDDTKPTQITHEQKVQIESLTVDLKDHLASGASADGGFRPETINRFSRMIPYRALSKQTFVGIATKKVRDLVELFRVKQDIHIILKEDEPWPQFEIERASDIAIYLSNIRVRASDTRAGGARGLAREIDMYLKDEIVAAIYENPGIKTFRAYVSEESRLYNPGVDNSKGGIVIEPVYSDNVGRF